MCRPVAELCTGNVATARVYCFMLACVLRSLFMTDKKDENKATLSTSKKEILSLDYVRFSGFGFLNQRIAF